ncbi:MAG TPA: MBL fold metallo-hydrolase [Chitinophagaceae bacterium]|nr:MBL fold metallo-hydrolase [Chitinophagaceae bacterium]
MKRISLLLCLVVFLFSGSSLNAQGKYLETIKVTDSIYVFKPKIDWLHGNGVAIIGSDGVFFIDTYIQTNYAEEAIQRLKQITRLPVKYVLNTHWHNDHVIGNYIFKKKFPACSIIAHDATFSDMIKTIKEAVATEMKVNDDGIAQAEKELKDGKTQNTGTPLTGSMKDFWEWQIREGYEYRKAYKGNQFANADITFSDSMTFHWGSQTIRLIHVASNGHSAGDVIAWIPEKRVVVTGDIIVGPTPYATYSNIKGMVNSIQSIIDLDPAVVIPGHGEIGYDLSYPRLLKQAFSTYIQGIEKAMEDKIPYREAKKSISFPEIDNKITGDDEIKKWAYRSFFINWMFYHIYKAHNALPLPK